MADGVIKPKERYSSITADNPEIDGFEFRDEIGQGGYASVYLYFDRKNCREVAVKRFAIGGTSSTEALKALQSYDKEIAILKNLSHSRIVKFYGYRENEKHLDLVLEYVGGGSLTKVLPLQENVAKKFLGQILQGLAYLHENKIIHRDIKCANILRDNAGNVKLTDFGISQRISTLSHSIKTNIAGSFLFMAPETLIGEKATAKADIWSVGCTFVEMLCNYPPNADCPTMKEIMTRVINNRMVYDLPANVSKIGQNFIKLLLEFEPEKRPSSIQALKMPYFFEDQLPPDDSDNNVAPTVNRNLKPAWYQPEIKPEDTHYYAVLTINESSKPVWYQPQMKKEETQRQLMQEAKDGKFLIRRSENPNGNYSIDIFFKGQTIHFHIEMMSNGKLTLNSKDPTQPRFNKLAKFVEYYQMHPIRLLKNNNYWEVKLVV